jgi:hypothetical protein
MTTREDIRNLIAYMMMAFPNYEPALKGEVNAIDVYLDLLDDLPLDTLKTAVRACCAEPDRKFAPSAGEIRGAAVQWAMQADGVPTVGQAWGAVIGSYERMPGGTMAGGGHGPVLDHPLVKEAMQELGGYTADLYENQMANRAHFFKIYEVLYDQVLRDKGQLPIVRAYIEANKQDTRLLERGL